MKRVISKKNLPVGSYPITGTVTAWMAMDYYNAPGWCVGAVMTIIGIIWIATIWAKIEQEEVDIFEKPTEKSAEATESKFMQKLKEKMSQKS